MSLAKRLLLLVFVAVALFTVAGGFYLRQKAEPLLRQKLAAACPDCRIDWKGFSLGISGLGFSDLDFESPKGISVYAVKARSLDIKLSWRQAYRGIVDIQAIDLDGADVKIMEIAGHNPLGTGDKPIFAVRGINITDSTFTYEIREKGKFGRIRLDAIEASISPFGTVPELRDAQVVGKAKARLEQSGEVTLEVETPYFSPGTTALIKLSLNGQTLGELNEYFTPIDGVELTGKVINGNTSAEIKENFLSAWADIRYEKFDVHFLHTKQRGGLKAFLSNIVADLKLDPKQTQPNGKSVGIKRHPLESIVSFVLRGLKEAALRVATS
jgi:hypothetical protein